MSIRSRVTRAVNRFVGNLINGAIDFAKKIAEEAAKKLQEEINNATKLITDTVKNITDSITEMVKNAANQIEDVYQKVQDELKKAIENLEKSFIDAVDSMQQSIVKITGSIAESVLPDFLEQAIKNNIQFISTFLGNITKNSISIASAASQGDLKAVEDDLKQTGRDFDDDFRASLRLIEDNANSIADSVQYVRDDIVRPAWNIARETISETAKTIEKEAIRPAINNLIKEIDLLVAVAAPDALAKQYEKTKAALEDAAKTLRETRRDVNESLEEFQEEVEKAGKTIDDMKIFIAQTAAVIAVSFVPGFGPLLAIGLQIIFDEINGNQSLADKLLAGDFSNIDQIIIAVAASTGAGRFASAAEAMNAIAKSMQVSAEVAKALETAAKAYEIYSKINQYKNTVEAIIDGDLKEVALELIKTAGQEFAASAGKELESYMGNIADFVDISKLLENEQLIKAAVSLNFSEIKDSAILLVADQISAQISTHVPADLENLLNQNDVKSLIQGDFSVFEDKAKNFISSAANAYLADFIPQNLTTILNPENITQLLKGDLASLKENLLQEISQNIANYSNINLPEALKNFVSSKEIAAFISGDKAILEEKFKGIIGAEIISKIDGIISPELLQTLKAQNLNQIKTSIIDYAQNQGDALYSSLGEFKQEILNDQSIQNALLFKNSIEQQITEVKGRIEEAKFVVEDYQAELAQYKQEFTAKLNDYLAIHQKEFAEIKASITQKYEDTKQLFSSYQSQLYQNPLDFGILKSAELSAIPTVVGSPAYTKADFVRVSSGFGIYSEFSDAINQTKTKIQSLLLAANQTLIANYITPIIENKASAQSQIDLAINEIKQSYQGKIDEIQVLNQNLESKINNRISEVRSFENDFAAKNGAIQSSIDFLQKNAQNALNAQNNILSKEYFDQLQLLQTNTEKFKQFIKNPDLADEIAIINQTSKQIDDAISNFSAQSQIILQKIYDARFDAISQGIINSIATSSQIVNQQFLKNLIQDNLNQIKQQADINDYLSYEAIKLIIAQTANNIKSSINIVSGDGNDSTINLANSTAKNYIIDNRGNDNITGGQSKDYIESGDGNDTINAGSGDDIVYGGSGNDAIYGGAGADELRGGDGDDVIYALMDGKFDYAKGKTLSTSNFGDENTYKKFLFDANNDGKEDLVYIYSGSEGMYSFTSISNGDGTFKNLTGGKILSGQFGSQDSYQKMITDLNGDGLKDIVFAYSGSYGVAIYNSLNLGQDFTLNTIFGDSGNDNLFGADGSDILIGGTGSDNLTGGAGADIFKFNFIEESFSNLSQNQLDLIADFEKGKDKIDLSAIGSITGFKQLDVIYDAARNETKLDDKNSDFAVKLAGNVALSESDFIF